MKNFCTVADKNFCERVWALNQSLLKNSKNYTLHVLALDEEAVALLRSTTWKNEQIKVYFVEDLKKADPHLQKSATNPPSYEALNVAGNDRQKATRMQFIWSLASYFTWYCLENLDCDDILYIDADILFFSNWERLYDNLGPHSVGIVEHRCAYSAPNGRYNVGIVYFKNDIDGYKCLTWWKNCLLFPDNQYRPMYGMCGDQKYLELFEKLFENVVILDEFIGHLAPWNYAYHLYEDEKIVWNGKKQDLMYCHFSNFSPDHENGTYIAAPRHGLVDIKNPFIKKIYDEYFEELRRVHA